MPPLKRSLAIAVAFAAWLQGLAALGESSADLAPVQLEQKLTQLSASHPLWNGPNCHQATLFIANLSQSIRYVDAPELLASLRWNHCQRLRDVKDRRGGDIGLLFNSHGDLIHSFTWVSDQLVVSKTGFFSSFRTTIETYGSMSSWFQPGRGQHYTQERWRCDVASSTDQSLSRDSSHPVATSLRQIERQVVTWVSGSDLPDERSLRAELKTLQLLAGDIATVKDPLERALLQARHLSLQKQILLLADPD
ncbi:MAG: hypothetical protein RJB38_2399 [Pseudomonadota bacterium]|jgi:hypothetical protein